MEGRRQRSRPEVLTHTSQWDHGACLRPLLAFAFVNHITNLIACIQLVEATAQDGIPVQIHLVARLSDEEAVFREEAHNGPDRRGSVRLDIASHLAGMVLKLALGCVERITDRNVQILMSMMLRRLAPHDDFPLRHDQLDSNMIQNALMVMPMVRFDNDTAGVDPIKEALELIGASADFLLSSNVWLDIAKCDTKRLLHDGLLNLRPVD
jgi:hypothetical protein